MVHRVVDLEILNKVPSFLNYHIVLGSKTRKDHIINHHVHLNELVLCLFEMRAVKLETGNH